MLATGYRLIYSHLVYELGIQQKLLVPEQGRYVTCERSKLTFVCLNLDRLWTYNYSVVLFMYTYYA